MLHGLYSTLLGAAVTDMTPLQSKREIHIQSTFKMSMESQQNHLSNEICTQHQNFVIRVADVEFEVHKDVLCGCSPYFSALFYYDWNKANVFTICGLSPDVMEDIIHFAYTGVVALTEDNVEALMMAADMFCVQDIVRICGYFLCKNLCPENCIGIWQLANACLHNELQCTAWSYIVDHFEEVVPCEDFLQLTVQELSKILSRDDINLMRESMVFEAILRWIDHKPQERERHMKELFSKFRVALTGVEYINVHVMTNDLVMKNPECQQRVRDALQLLRYMRQERSCALCNLLARPRLPSVTLLAIGGYRARGHNGIEAYDIGTDSWVNVAKRVKLQRADHAIAFFEGHIYFVGGCEKGRACNNLTRLNLSRKSWHDMSPMFHHRRNPSVAVLNGTIYAIGGLNHHHICHNSVECYRPATNGWTIISPMCKRRAKASSTTLHGKIYICGGSNGKVILQTVECYNPETDQWTLIAPMIRRRCEHGVVAHDGCIYAVGVYGPYIFNSQRSAEVYDPKSDRWKLLSSMKTSRRNFGLQVVDGKIYAFGDQDNYLASRRVEYYNPKMDQWVNASNMNHHSDRLSCCLVFGVSYMKKYGVPRDSLPFIQLEKEFKEEAEVMKES